MQARNHVHWRRLIMFALPLVAGCITESTSPDAEAVAVRQARGGTGGGGGGGQTSGVTITPATATVTTGATLQLTAVVTNSKTTQDKTLTWSSSDESIATVSGTGLVTGVAAGGPVTITAATGGKKSVSGTATITVEEAIPGWTTLVASSDAASGAVAWTTDAPGDEALFAVIGSGDYQGFALWRFDLKTDTWSQVPTSNTPAGKYRQIVHDPVNHRILTFWDGRGQVYAVSENGGSWQAVGSTGNNDEYFGAVSLWNPVSSRLSIFGGYGYYAWKNTFFAFSEATFTWDAVAQSTLKPGPRFAATSGVDETGNSLFINSGQGNPSGSQFDAYYVYNDLWKLDLQTNTWAEIIAHDGNPAPTIGAGMDYVPGKNAVYRFGGSHGASDPNYLDDIEMAIVGAGAAWSGVDATGTAPSPRNAPGLYYDAPRQRLIVVGGQPLSGNVKLDVYALGRI